MMSAGGLLSQSLDLSCFYQNNALKVLLECTYVSMFLICILLQ